MAQKVAAATGAWSAAATWNSVTNTPTLHASTNITLNSTTGIFTAGFTAPDLVSACTGVLLFVTTVPVTATYVVTLQESTVDTAATVSIVSTAFPITSNWIYFKFATPYVFTTLTASAYRFKITRASATTNAIVAADSGGTLPAYLATDNRTGVPGATDDVWIVTANGTGTVTVTMDGTQTIGNGGNTTGISQRTITNAVTISQGGLLTWDIVATAQLTSKGNITIGGGGELRMGTVATPYPTAQTATLIFNENGTGGNYGLESYISGKLTLQGELKTTTSLWKTTYVSGAGTAASPMIVTDAVDWAVNDEIIVCAYSSNATNYNESENKFIRTKNSATSYVLSDTAGGAEAALAFTHTAGAYIINVTRNVIIKSSTTTEGFYYYNPNTVAGEVNIDWVRFESVGANITNKNGLTFSASGQESQVACDYSVAYRALHRGFFFNGGTITATYTGLVGCNANTGSATVGVITTGASKNRTFVDCFAIKNNRGGFETTGSANIIFTRCIGISNNIAGGASNTASCGLSMTTTTVVTLNSCEFHCNRIKAILFSGVTFLAANSCLVGTKGLNAIDISIVSDTFADAVFISSSFGSATFVSNYLNLVVGSEIRFQTLNLTANNHTWYTPQGVARSSGAGLVDTTNKTAGNLTIRLAPEDSTIGFIWEFLIGLKASSAASIFGFAQKNVAFGTDVCTVQLFLPGSIIADATATLDNTTGAWQVFSLAANYTGLVADFATIRITAKTITASAYVYFTDFYNGTNVLTGLQAWYQGKPSPVFTDLLGDPASVWAILESTQTTVGTMGYEISTDLATLRADVDDLQTRVPAALTVGGNIKADALMIEGVDATNQIRDSILTDATRFAGADIATIKGYIDTEIATLIANVATVLAAVDTEVGDIKAKTDNLPTDPADESNILAAIAALNNPSTAAIVTAILTELIKGKTVKEVWLDIWAQTVGDATADSAAAPTLIAYKSPDNSTEVTHTLTPTTRVQS